LEQFNTNPFLTWEKMIDLAMKYEKYRSGKMIFDMFLVKTIFAINAYLYLWRLLKRELDSSLVRLSQTSYP
jgi:hypothetical protein